MLYITINYALTAPTSIVHCPFPANRDDLIHQQYFNAVLKERIVDPVLARSCGFEGGGIEAVTGVALQKVARRLSIPKSKWELPKSKWKSLRPNQRRSIAIRREIGRRFFHGKLTRIKVAKVINAVKPSMKAWVKQKRKGKPVKRQVSGREYRRQLTLQYTSKRHSNGRRKRWTLQESAALCKAVQKSGLDRTHPWVAVQAHPGLEQRTHLMCRDRMRNIMNMTGTSNYEDAAEKFNLQYMVDDE